jgi:hypothetical protein
VVRIDLDRDGFRLGYTLGKFLSIIHHTCVTVLKSSKAHIRDRIFTNTFPSTLTVFLIRLPRIDSNCRYSIAISTRHRDPPFCHFQIVEQLQIPMQRVGGRGILVIFERSNRLPFISLMSTQ